MGLSGRYTIELFTPGGAWLECVLDRNDRLEAAQALSIGARS